MAKRSPGIRALWAVVIVAAGSAAPAQQPIRSKVLGAGDYQRVADRRPWGWSDEQATPLYCLSQADSPYDIVMISKHGHRDMLTFRCVAGEKVAYQWQGDAANSVFSLQGDRLYYVDFRPASSGGTVVAVDLPAGKELWRSALRALGGPPHFGYRTRVAIGATGDVVNVIGNETGGRYFEIKDAKTGETVGHKVFTESPPVRKGG